MKHLSGQESNLRVATGEEIICLPRSMVRSAVEASAIAWGASSARAENVALDVSSFLAVESATRRAEREAKKRRRSPLE